MPTFVETTARAVSALRSVGTSSNAASAQRSARLRRRRRSPGTWRGCSSRTIVGTRYGRRPVYGIRSSQWRQHNRLVCETSTGHLSNLYGRAEVGRARVGPTIGRRSFVPAPEDASACVRRTSKSRPDLGASTPFCPLTSPLHGNNAGRRALTGDRRALQRPLELLSGGCVRMLVACANDRRS